MLQRTFNFLPKTSTWFKILTKYPYINQTNTHIYHRPSKRIDFNHEDIFTMQKRLAGHSKWANIRHVKAAKDKEKNLVFNKIGHTIRLAIRESGGQSDPKLNNKLSYALEQARKANMPNSTIESLIKAASVSKQKLEPVLFEIKGPGSCFLLVETLTENATRTKHTVKSVLNKMKCTFSEGISKHLFDHRGIINVEINESKTLDKALEDAIEVGAEDVIETTIDDEKRVFQFQSNPRDFYTVKKRLEDMKYAIHSSSLEYIPNMKQTLSDSDLSTTEKLYDLLETIPDVVRIYDNID